MDNTNWQGRVALVTGAARGIGLATAQALARHGCTVVGWDIPGADWTQANESMGPDWLAFEGDVSQAADWQRAVATAQDRFGRLDILVNNAGISGEIAPVFRFDDAVFDRVIAINQRGVYLGLKHVGALMREVGRGSIINIASNAGLGAGPGMIAYTASKHAVVAMTKTAAGDLAGRNVRVNAVCPSPTDTHMVRDMAQLHSPADPDLVIRRLTANNPTGRCAEPAEIANVVVFLASDAASYINGSTLLVDGGLAVGG